MVRLTASKCISLQSLDGRDPLARLLPVVSRRTFVKLIGLSAMGATGIDRQTPQQHKIVGFVKPFQRLPYEQIADIAHQVGWSGIECPVRKDGVIQPERAEEELPKMFE